MTIDSPCNKVCVIERMSGHCIGCGRSGEEIGAWPGASDAERLTILAELPARMAALSAPFPQGGSPIPSGRRA